MWMGNAMPARSIVAAQRKEIDQMGRIAERLL